MEAFNGQDLRSSGCIFELRKCSWVGRADVGIPWGSQGVGGGRKDEPEIAVITSTQVGLDVDGVALELTAPNRIFFRQDSSLLKVVTHRMLK
jgi:hypothetical protein